MSARLSDQLIWLSSRAELVFFLWHATTNAKRDFSDQLMEPHDLKEEGSECSVVFFRFQRPLLCKLESHVLRHLWTVAPALGPIV